MLVLGRSWPSARPWCATATSPHPNAPAHPGGLRGWVVLLGVLTAGTAFIVCWVDVGGPLLVPASLGMIVNLLIVPSARSIFGDHRVGHDADLGTGDPATRDMTTRPGPAPRGST